MAVAQTENVPPSPTTAPEASGPTTVEAPVASAECIPNCRSGFLCHQGQCVSRCNPACAAGERCLANGECEAPAPPAAQPTFVPMPNPPPSGAAGTELDIASATTSNPALRAPGSFVFAARGGLQVLGGGHIEGECSAEGAFSCFESSGRTDTDENTPFMLGLDALVHATPQLRLGAGYQWLPYSEVTARDSSEDVHLGHEHALHALFEGVVPLSRNIALALRARGGLHLLMVGGDLADRNDDFLRVCSDTPAAHCEVDRGPLLGMGYGAMVGIVGGANVRWRIDLAIERFTLSLPDSKLELQQANGASSVTQSATLHGTRSWILGGIEL
jgi:hypothetical protein